MDNYLHKVIGERYEIQEIIGIGGMSIVYKAYDRVDDRIVAVKILKDEFMANEEFRMRFKNESKAISMLSHPNIVKVYDVSFGENLQYIVMEYVEGITLKEYIERQKVLDIREAEHFVIQILRALQHAHDKGIIHRDIKPQNIILLPNANIKVTDFGIARFNHFEARNVNESSAIGSVHYVSPEQAKGEYTDARSDIYSVGVVLYEMLTGRVPFDAETDSSIARMQLMQDAVRPSSLNPAIPVGLEQITLRALQKNPADRYQSAAEFLSDLYEFKKNPQMKFDYTYFVDRDQTKFIDAVDPVLTTADIPVKILGDEDYEETIDEDEDADEEESERNLTVPILVGIAVALVLVIVAILFVAFGDSIIKTKPQGSNTSSSQESSFWSKLDIFGWFSNDKIEVPNFINMDFEEVFSKYPDLAIDTTPKYVYNTTYEAGKVIEQSPDAGTMVSPDTVITLSVATNNDMVQVPDVTNYNFEEAESILVAKGFTVELLQAYVDDADENTVVYTDPKPDTFALYGSRVYVYYATPKEDIEGTTRVPNVIGDQEGVARQKIIAAGLKVGAVTTDESSAALKGYVIGQNPSTGATVNAGTVVNLVIGNGVKGSSTATFQITLPNLGGRTGTIRTYLNGEVYNTFGKVALTGDAFTVSFTGSGEENEFTVYVDSSKLYSGNIDFTKSTGKVSDVYTYSVAIRENVPNVVGKKQKDAVKELEKYGFMNVSIETAYSKDVAKGYVISQTPVSSKLTQYSINVTVKLVVSAGKDKGNKESDTTEPNTTEPKTTEKHTEKVTEEATEKTTEKPTEKKTTEPESTTEEPTVTDPSEKDTQESSTKKSETSTKESDTEPSSKEQPSSEEPSKDIAEESSTKANEEESSDPETP